MLWTRARAQRLTRNAAAGTRPATILHEVFGLQAQVWSAATLGMRARSAGLDPNKIKRALNDERSIVRTWLMRGTLHVVAAEDLRWLLYLLGPVFARAGSTRLAQLGLDDGLKARGVAAIRKILAEAGPLTRDELVDRLRSRHVVLDPKTQAPIHLIGLAALQGSVCLGPDRDDGQSTYVLLDDWVPQTRTPSRESALAELARRYFAAYGPATIDDLSAWSGLPAGEAHSAISGAKVSLTEVTIQRKPAFVLKEGLKRAVMPAKPEVRLLPAFDTYLRLSATRPGGAPTPAASPAAGRRMASPRCRRQRPGRGRLEPAPDRPSRSTHR